MPYNRSKSITLSRYYFASASNDAQKKQKRFYDTFLTKMRFRLRLYSGPHWELWEAYNACQIPLLAAKWNKFSSFFAV